MNTIDAQIKEMYNKVFYEIIDETVSSGKPDYVWILKLYSEIKERLLKFIKKDSKVYAQIDEEFDIELFKQMIENDVFNNDSLIKLINTAFYWVKFLGAPIRDKDVDESKNRVLTSEPVKIVSTFIREINMCIDNIDQDIINFIKETKGL